MTDTSAAVTDDSLGRTIAERQRPLRQRRGSVTGVADAPGRPGLLGRRSSSFSLGAGLSLSTRRQLGLVNPDPNVSWLPVAPPAEWDDSLLGPEQVRTGDATLDRIIASQRSSAAAKPATPQRGLRSAIGRRNTPIGRNTAPGASAQRLRPQAAPPALSPDVRRAVSGDGPAFGMGASRPRASGNSPAGGAPSSRAPSSRTGRRARGRVERSAPWHQNSAQFSAPASMGMNGPISVSGRSLARAETPWGLSGTASPDHPAGWVGSMQTAALPAALGLPADTASVANAPVGPLSGAAPADLAATVAAIAGAVEQTAVGDADRALALGAMARGSRPLVPSVRAPGSSHSARQPAAPSAQRMAERRRVQVSAAPGAAASSGALAPAGTWSREGALSPVRASSPAGTASPLGTVSPAGTGAAPGSVPSAVTAGGTAPIGSAAILDSAFAAASSAGAPAQQARANQAAIAAGLTPPLTGAAGPSAAVSALAAALSESRADSEPALAAMLRAQPPRLSLASSPRRTFTSASALTAASPAVHAAPTPGLGRAVAAQGANPTPIAGVSAAMRSLAPLAVVSSDGGLGRAVGAQGATSTPIPGGGAAGLRGLGSVAALVSTPTSVSTNATGRTTAEAGHSSRAASNHARRTVRTLPNLALPTWSPRSLTSTTASASGTAPALYPGVGPATTAAVGPPPAVPIDPGERFAQVLAQHSSPALSKLPQRFEPIARAILPDPSKVRLSTGAATRQALASVGKQAATAGDVVHLAKPLDNSRRSIEILAHELTHVASPSPLVRFLDDDRDSAEERRAREMESLMARAPVGSPPASPPPASSSGSSSSSGGSSSNGSFDHDPTSHHSMGGNSTGDDPSTGSSEPQNRGPAGALRPENPPNTPAIIDPDLGLNGQSIGHGDMDIDRLLDALESRIIRELERRGRRWPRPL